MKKAPMILLLALGVSGCDSIKKSVIQTDKSVEKLAVEMNDHAGSSGSVQNLTEGEFEAFSQQEGRLVVVDFYADWCGPCKQLAPMLDKLAVEYGDRVAVGKVDFDASAELANRLGVEGIPDVRFYRDGEQVDKIIGLPPETELRSRIEKNMGKVEAAPKAAKEKKPENIVQNAIQKANGKEPVAAKPVEKIEPAKPKETKQPATAKEAKEPEKPKEPTIQPMKKDWMPPGMQRRGG
jgi:thioredoxin 1